LNKLDTTLCDITKSDLDKFEKEIKKIVKKPKYICKKCLRVSSKKEYLCKSSKL